MLIIAMAPVLSRLFTPEEFGVYYLFLGIGGILSLIATGGFEKSYVLIESDKKARRVLAFTLFLIFLSMLVLFIAAWLLDDDLGRIFNHKYKETIIVLIPVYTTLVSILRVLQHWEIRENRFSLHSGSNVSRAVLMSAGQFGTGLSGHTGTGLISGAILGQISGIIYLLAKKSAGTIRKSFDKLSLLYAAAKEYKAFPRFYMPSGLINEASIQLPIFALKFFFSTGLAGIYSLPHKVLSQPSRLLGYAVGEVYYRTASTELQAGRDISQLTLKVFRTLLLIGFIPFGILTAWGEQVFSFAFGPEWTESGEIASYLSPWLLAVFAGSPVSYVFNLKNRLDLSFRLNLFVFAGRALSLMAGFLIYGTLEPTIMFFSAFSLLSWIIIIIISLKLAGVKPRQLAFSILIILGLAIALVLIKILLG